MTINKAPLTVTANNASKIYGDANPALSTTVSGFVNNENLATSGVTGSGSATTTATASTGAGTAAITAGVGSLSASNYDFSNLVSGTLTINEAEVKLITNSPKVIADSTSSILEALTKPPVIISNNLQQLAELKSIKPTEASIANLSTETTTLTIEDLLSFKPVNRTVESKVEASKVEASKEKDEKDTDEIVVTSKSTATSRPEVSNANMTDMQVRTVTPEQLNNLPKDQIKEIKPTQSQEPTATQLPSLKPGVVENLSLAQLSVMNSSQLQALASPQAPNSQPKTGTLAITILNSDENKTGYATFSYEQNADTVSLKTTAAPGTPAISDKQAFTDKFAIFLVTKSNGEMVEFQGALINNRMVIVAPSIEAKSLARNEMNLVIATIVNILAKDNPLILSQIEGVVLDLR